MADLSYLSNLILDGNLELTPGGGYQIKNATFESVTADPSTNLFDGRMIYRSDLDQVKVCDGTLWHSIAGDITGITAGTGLSGGGTLGTVTLNLSHLGIQDLADPNADRIFFWDDDAGASAWLTVDTASGVRINGTTLTLASIPNTSLANSGVTITAGNGLADGGAVALGGSVTLNVGAGVGIAVNANDVALKNAGAFTNNYIQKWNDTAGQLTDSIISDNGSTVTVAGNLDVTGTTTTFDSTVVAIADSMMELAKDNSGNALDIGIYGTAVDGATTIYPTLFYDSANSSSTTVQFKIGHAGTEPGGTVTDFTLGNLSASKFIGTLQGSASTLTTARNIELVGDVTGNADFDGSADIDITATVVTATTTTAGKVELATNAEAITGADTTRAVTPAGAAALVSNRQAAARHTELIGDGTNTTLRVNHALNTDWPLVQVYRNSDNAMVLTEVVVFDADNVDISFNSAPATDAYTAVILAVG